MLFGVSEVVVVDDVWSGEVLSVERTGFTDSSSTCDMTVFLFLAHV